MCKLPVMPVTALLMVRAAAQPEADQARPLTFDAASVKPATPVAAPDDTGKTVVRKQPGGGESESPGRIHYRESLKRLLMRAYNVAYYQIQGPDSLSTMFLVDAIMPPETTKEQLRGMLQNLLVERFKLAAHRETKELPGYFLVVAKSSAKLREPAEASSPRDGVALGPPLDPRQRPPLGPGGFPGMLPPLGKSAETGISMFSSPYGWKVFSLVPIS